MIDLVDLHSHHLPGVDDGPKSMGEAAEQVRRLGALGYRVLVTTPHVIQGRYENRRTGIESAVAALQAEVGPAPQVRIGAEHRFDGAFLELLEADALVPLGGRGRAVLVEFAWPKLPFNLLDVLYRIQIRGWIPLLAHPDRYRNDDGDFERLRAWVE